MVLLSLAASHHDLDLDVLERLSSDVQAVASELVHSAASVSGAVVLATCNRFELYLEVDDAQDAPSARAAAAADGRRAVGLHAPTQVASHLRVRTGTDAAAHLFAVASGLDSMVVGEREIAGQVRRALTTARRDGTTTSGLESLFQAASRVSRDVEARTGLGATGRSVVGVALDIAQAQLPDWSAVRCVLIGTGSYAGASLAAAQGPRLHRRPRLLHDRPRRGVRRGPWGPRPCRRAPTWPPRSPTSTSSSPAAAPRVPCSGSTPSPRPAPRDARPLTVVDLALRHDVDPGVRSLPGVRLVSLHTVSEHAPAEHAAVEAAHDVVTAAAEAYEADRRVRDWNPAVVAERTRVLGRSGGPSWWTCPTSAPSAPCAAAPAPRCTARPSAPARPPAPATRPRTPQALAELAAIPVPSRRRRRRRLTSADLHRGWRRSSPRLIRGDAAPS